jgi:DIM1 family U5 snRNP protein
MLAASHDLPSLPSAQFVDETLLDARTQNRVVAIRFGRIADPLCQAADARLREASEALIKAKLLSVYTVDVDEVREFTHMYELYDPFTFMLFHRSKPVVIDAGHGPSRKLTELPPGGGAPLAALLASAVRQALDADADSPVRAGAREARPAFAGDERADDAATYADEASRLAGRASEWLSRGLRLAEPMTAGGWAAVEYAGAEGRAALASARQRSQQVLHGLADALGAPASAPEAAGEANAESPREAEGAPPPVEPSASLPQQSQTTSKTSEKG